MHEANKREKVITIACEALSGQIYIVMGYGPFIRAEVLGKDLWTLDPG